jgi:hypothetical protein
MTDPTDDEIRSRAYAFWEQDGRPEGKAVDHWVRARNDLESEADAGPDGNDQASDHRAAALEQTDGPDRLPIYP